MRKHFRTFRSREKYSGQRATPQIFGIYGLTKDYRVIPEVSQPGVKPYILFKLDDPYGCVHYYMTDGTYWVPINVKRDIKWGKKCWKTRYSVDTKPPEFFLSEIEREKILKKIDEADLTVQD